uniref:DUF5348 domain-containing protein n=1 Tax=unclassified Paenibacillus TaxID=185978 RepID=UPI00403F992F
MCSPNLSTMFHFNRFRSFTHHNIIDPVTSPIAADGVLTRNSNGRFTLVGRELTSGRSIEYLYKGDSDDIESWYPCRIEYYNDDYLIWKHPEIQLVGLLALCELSF